MQTLSIKSHKSSPSGKSFKVLIVSSFAGINPQGWYTRETRHAEVIMFGEIAKMMIHTNTVPGKLIIHEYLESEFPKQLEDKEQYLKKHGNSYYLKDGQRICRVTEYDPTGKLDDVYIKHDMIVRGKMKPKMYSEEFVEGLIRSFK